MMIPSSQLLEELDEREDGDTREVWWAEIRQEVRSHARALACNIIIGYEARRYPTLRGGTEVHTVKKLFRPPSRFIMSST